jgi:hypothetical protein
MIRQYLYDIRMISFVLCALLDAYGLAFLTLIVLISGFQFVIQLYTLYIKADVECNWEHFLFNVVGILYE